MIDQKLTGRIAVVTGAGQGIGAAIARLYAKHGAKVAVADINIESAEAVVDEIRDAGGEAIGVRCDVASRTSVNEAASHIFEQLGPIDVLVSNAGVTRTAMLWKMTDEEWDAVISTHLNGSFYWLQAVVDGMRERQYGRIIFTTSGAGLVGSIGQINYASAKAALLGLTRSAAKELAGAAITVNAIAPIAATPMTETVRTNEKFKDTYLDSIPLRRWAKPEEIAESYLFLASDAAAYMTGQVLSVDGGRTSVR